MLKDTAEEFLKFFTENVSAFQAKCGHEDGEKRIANDGMAYTWSEFVHFYQDGADWHWQAAQKMQESFETIMLTSVLPKITLQNLVPKEFAQKAIDCARGKSVCSCELVKAVVFNSNNLRVDVRGLRKHIPVLKSVLEDLFLSIHILNCNLIVCILFDVFFLLMFRLKF